MSTSCDHNPGTGDRYEPEQVIAFAGMRNGTHYDCVTIVLVMRGFAQGPPILQLAEELELDYEALLNRRHAIQQLALEHKPSDPLSDAVSEADEMFQNAGEKGKKHDDPAEPTPLSCQQPSWAGHDG